MNDIEKEFLSDTIAILIGYDGEHEVEGLKALIDETRERLTKLYKRQVTKVDNGIAFNLDSPFEVLEGGKSNQGNDDENKVKTAIIQQLNEKSYNFLFEGKNNEYDEEYKDYICGEKTENTEECKVTKIDNVLTKYENFYKGGSGYTFQIEVDDFNELVEGIAKLEKEIEEHCETKGKLGKQVFALTKRVDELVEERKGFKDFIRDCYMNWDCDDDAHKYNTTCRACEAEKLIK